MRIKCNPKECHLEDDAHKTDDESAASCVDYQTLGISRMRNQNISTEIIGDLESTMAENKPTSKETTSKENVSSENQHGENFTCQSTADETDRVTEKIDSTNVDQVDGNILGGNVILGDYETKPEKDTLLPTYKDFSRRDSGNNNNNGNDAETLRRRNEARTKENVEPGSSQGKPYALATLDGTIMLVKDEVILWQVFEDDSPAGNDSRVIRNRVSFQVYAGGSSDIRSMPFGCDRRRLGRDSGLRMGRPNLYFGSTTKQRAFPVRGVGQSVLYRELQRFAWRLDTLPRVQYFQQ